MSLMRRLAMLFRAKANKALDRAEDPREMLDYSYEQQLEMVCLLAAALRVIGANRVLLRDYLANQGSGQESGTSMPFDPAGNSLREFSVVQLESTDDASKP